MPQQPTEDVKGGLTDDEVTVQQPDIDAALGKAVAIASEELRVAGRRPLNAGPQTVAFGGEKRAQGRAEQGGVRVTVTITIV